MPQKRVEKCVEKKVLYTTLDICLLDIQRK